MDEKSINLYFTDDRSDKVYQAQLKQDGDGYRVFFQYGPRGKSMTSGEKTKEAIPYEAALKVYNTLVGSKTKKGYTEQVDGATFTSPDVVGRKTEYAPQLMNDAANPKDQRDDSNWLAQEKHNGENRGVIARDGVITFANKKGLELAVNAEIAAPFAALASCASGHRAEAKDFIIAAEDMGGWIAVYDIIEHPDLSANATFSERAALLESMSKWSAENGFKEIMFVDIPMPLDDFRKLRMPALMARNAEGYVKKHRHNVYEPGRPASGGDALKVKWTETLSARCDGQNDNKRSVGISLLDDDDGEWKTTGNVTIPANASIPAEGAVIEVIYLYAEKSGALHQPVYDRERNDVDLEECLTSQRKYKGDNRLAPISEDDLEVEPVDDAYDEPGMGC